MAKRIFSKRTLALILSLVMCFSMFQVTAHAAAGRWSYNFYLCQEYLGNAGGAAVKPDPVGYGFQGVIDTLTFTDDNGKVWTFRWNTAQNGDWKASGNGVSEADAKYPAITDDDVYVGTYTGKNGTGVISFTLNHEDTADSWSYTDRSSHYANWCCYIRFIREYTVNVFYQNETGSVSYNGINYTAEEPLVRSFHFLFAAGRV